MRQRKVKNLEEKLSSVSEYRVALPKCQRGRWAEIFENDCPVYLELGCGKGQFILEYAKKYPERNYIGIEGQESVCLRAMEKAAQRGVNHEGLKNIMFVSEFIEDISEYFAEDELSGIYLNFSDPWPKARHAKRRLTYEGKLKAYFNILKQGSSIEVKTDNDELFEFTLEEILKIEKVCAPLTIAEVSRNLHETELEAADITTEYEDKFKAYGKNINYVKVVKDTLC